MTHLAVFLTFYFLASIRRLLNLNSAVSATFMCLYASVCQTCHNQSDPVQMADSTHLKPDNIIRLDIQVRHLLHTMNKQFLSIFYQYFTTIFLH